MCVSFAYAIHSTLCVYVIVHASVISHVLDAIMISAVRTALTVWILPEYSYISGQNLSVASNMSTYVGNRFFFSIFVIEETLYAFQRWRCEWLRVTRLLLDSAIKHYLIQFGWKVNKKKPQTAVKEWRGFNDIFEEYCRIYYFIIMETCFREAINFQHEEYMFTFIWSDQFCNIPQK